MIFELDNVELYFKNKRILNGIYLKAETGVITGILGRNGSGKSSLLNILFGNLKSKYKSVRIDNIPIQEPLYQTKLVKYLPQFHFAPNRMKLKTALKLYNLNWNAFINVFGTFSKYESYRFSKLSGSERRLIEIYLVLKSDSKLVLLDEPFTHLAPKHIEAIKTLIVEATNHKAIVITGHMYKHIIDLTDTFYLLQNGCTQKTDTLSLLRDYNYLKTTN